MEFNYRELLFVWKLNSGRWNPLATTAVVPFVMLIRTIFIPSLDCFDSERNALSVSVLVSEAQRLPWVRGWEQSNIDQSLMLSRHSNKATGV